MANFTNGTPTVTNKNVRDFTLNVQTDVNATVKYLLVPYGVTSPTASEINNNTYGANTIRSGQITTTKNILASGVVV